MNPIGKNILAVVVGLVVGGVVNMGLITIGMSVIPLPGGGDFNSMEAVRAAMKVALPQHFVFPFLGHAVGTLVGAFIAAKLAAGQHMKLAMVIGGFFLFGGIAMILNCGGPVWFIATDLLLAYIPMAYLGGILGGGKKS
jgi:hypothetical protein